MKEETRGILGALSAILILLALVGVILQLGGMNVISLFDPSVVVDRTVEPSSHALFGIVGTVKPGTYHIFAETLSRGEPVAIGIHYRIPKPTTPDRFGSTEYENSGIEFITDNNRIVNETVIVPEAAIDGIVTVSYHYYISENNVHIKVKKILESELVQP